GAVYDVTVTGTFSYIGAVFMNNPLDVCGTADPAPTTASPDVTNGATGIDAETIFASGSQGARPATCPTLPAAFGGFRMDTGAGFVDPVPTATVGLHSYRYRVTGQGVPATFRVNDCCSSDNYGVLTIKVAPATGALLVTGHDPDYHAVGSLASRSQ